MSASAAQPKRAELAFLFWGLLSMGVREDKNNKERQAILREWDSWAKQYPIDSPLRGVEFFDYLQANKPTLLDFKSDSVDKSQAVRSWLLRGGRVKN